MKKDELYQPSSRKARIRVECKIQDLWIGVFWKWGYEDQSYDLQKVKQGYGHQCYSQQRFDLWLCLFPCLPIHFVYIFGPIKDATLQRRWRW